MDTNQIFAGHISRFDNKRNFGFIETEDNQSFFFFYEKESTIDRVWEFYSGDEVEFKLRPSQKDNNKKEAFDVRFIRNISREILVQEAKEKNLLSGYLKQVDKESIYIKHLTTYIFIPIQISVWETDLQKVYTDRINQLVEFKLTQTETTDKLYAVLSDRKFSPEYNLVQELWISGKETLATITGKNSAGYSATILSGTVNGFIHLQQTIQSPQDFFSRFRNGDKTKVKIKRFNGARKSISFKLSLGEELDYLELKPIKRKENCSIEKLIEETEQQPYILSQVSKKKLEKANQKHSFTLKVLKNELTALGYEVTESKHIDAFAIVKNIPAIFEIKSINEENENDQVRAAISQLYEYRYLYSLKNATLWIVFSEKPFSDWIVEYLSKDRGIKVLWIEYNQLTGISKEHLN